MWHHNYTFSFLLTGGFWQIATIRNSNPKKGRKTILASSHTLDVPTNGWQGAPAIPDSERFPPFLKWQKESLRLKMVLQWTISVQWRLKQGWSQQEFGIHPLLLLLWNFSSLDVGCCALNLFQLSLCKAQLQFHFSWENNFPFKAKPVHTFQYIQVSLFVQVLRPFTTQVVFAIFWGWMLFAKIKQIHVITYFFYSLFLKLNSQASTSSKGIHTVNFTDPH